MAHPANHEDCPAFARSKADATGADIVIYTEPPTGLDPYWTPPFVCPHGQQFHLRPTEAQIATWEAGGVQ